MNKIVFLITLFASTAAAVDARALAGLEKIQTRLR